jgi:methyltransferase (TIGR00027 family)
MSRRSLVAGVNALFRSRESQVPPPARLLDDPYARIFGERHPLVWLLRTARFLLPPLRRLIDELQIAHCVRHRSIDELCLQAALRDRYQQIVLVGAGYDTRPLRLRARLPGVRWIEVDHPATAARKARLVGRLGLPAHALRVALDLERQALIPALAAAGFDPAVPTCFVLEGLAHYLPRACFARLLADMARGPARRRIVLSYIRREMAGAAPSLFLVLVRLLREIPATHFDRAELADLASQNCLQVTGSWSFCEQIERLLAVPTTRAPRLSQEVITLEK